MFHGSFFFYLQAVGTNQSQLPLSTFTRNHWNSEDNSNISKQLNFSVSGSAQDAKAPVIPPLKSTDVDKPLQEYVHSGGLQHACMRIWKKNVSPLAPPDDSYGLLPVSRATEREGLSRLSRFQPADSAVPLPHHGRQQTDTTTSTPAWFRESLFHPSHLATRPESTQTGWVRRRYMSMLLLVFGYAT